MMKFHCEVTESGEIKICKTWTPILDWNSVIFSTFWVFSHSFWQKLAPKVNTRPNWSQFFWSMPTFFVTFFKSSTEDFRAAHWRDFAIRFCTVGNLLVYCRKFSSLCGGSGWNSRNLLLTGNWKKTARNEKQPWPSLEIFAFKKKKLIIKKSKNIVGHWTRIWTSIKGPSTYYATL